MGAIANGLAYDGLFIPFAATFLQFADYMRPPVRLAALSGLQTIYVWTHDSIFLGEDGPTHQPIEHLTALRAIPNLHVCRPCDGEETAVAWAHALGRRDGPTALVLTRQKLAPVRRDGGFDPEAMLRGGYVVAAPEGAPFSIIATGSEVPLAQAALELLAAKGLRGRLVSMPCLACFHAQPKAWQDAVLPPALPARCARGGARDRVVAARRQRRARARDRPLRLERAGEGAREEYGFTPAKVAGRIESWLAQR